MTGASGAVRRALGFALVGLSLVSCRVLADLAAGNHRNGGSMAREEANRMVKAFLQSLGENALADTGYALFNTKEGVAQISFAYDEEQKALLCHAEIHRFEPNDITAEELEAFREEEKAGTPTGGGRLEYVAETKGLYLTRAYDRPVEEKLFLREMQALGEAAERWGGDEIFGRVVERARVKTAASSTRR